MKSIIARLALRIQLPFAAVATGYALGHFFPFGSAGGLITVFIAAMLFSEFQALRDAGSSEARASASGSSPNDALGG